MDHVNKFMEIFKNLTRYIRLPSRRNGHKLSYFREVISNPQPINMFKLAVFAAILAVALAAPGGLTGVAISHGTGPILAPAVISAAPALSLGGAHVIAQPVAPAVHTPPVVTRTVLAGHGLGLGLGLVHG
ncbi:uncharacterized protein LOC105431842 [Pogonomyrmex barbatus]|uniref:Uncharacterized protein LOC105431842 n=1 Tax=Pogonomyrmex barbatus TaxID=144034 RepID=A0A6I9XGN9_9HYME|nr:uncharacterized protein LOC105431842 [Pogonomyrmex barbatus]